MHKRLIDEDPQLTAAADWLKLDELAEVEISSEDARHPIESALLAGAGSGWRAAVPGKQTIRLLFAQPQQLRRIRVRFVETAMQRTQEYLLRWSGDAGQSFREIVRQQWNFSPEGSVTQTEEHRVDLSGVTVLELIITPDVGNEHALASLAELRIA
ncbi:MAG: carbohydrate-binding protein [Candidatus Accumulibacter sp.]|nr:carbohydrate-binding protein [Accumulibacter sp.]